MYSAAVWPVGSLARSASAALARRTAKSVWMLASRGVLGGGDEIGHVG